MSLDSTIALIRANHTEALNLFAEGDPTAERMIVALRRAYLALTGRRLENESPVQ